MSRATDYDVLNTPGQDFRLYVGFGDEIRIGVDGNMKSPPPTVYPEHLSQVPFRPTAVLGPHRIGFVGEAVPFYGGYSYGRWRRAAIGHQWSATGSPIIRVKGDTLQAYPTGVAEKAYASFTWDGPGIYEVSLTVRDDGGKTHTGKRQVIVYDSREIAYAGVTEVTGLSGATDQGGWTCSFRIRGDASFLLNARDVIGYIPVVVYADTFYELTYGTMTRKTLGPNWQTDDFRDDPRIIFSGYLDKSSIETDVDGSGIVFQARTADMILEQMQTGTFGFFESANNGSGIIFNDLMTHDVIRHMLQEHSTWIDWHDTRLFYNRYATSSGVAGPSMEYNDWTFNAGMYWSNIRDIAANQFEVAYVDQRGSLFVIPDRNMWPPEVFHVNPSVPIVRLGPEEDPIGSVSDHLQTSRKVCVPITLNLTERLSAAVAYYKIIASLSFYNEEWGADYPKGQPANSSGRWELVQGKYYSDQKRDIAWALLWKFAGYGYAAANARYTLQVSYGAHTYWRLADTIALLYEDPQGRASFVDEEPITNYFEIVGISYEISTEAQQWRTTYMMREVTTYSAPEVTVPPTPARGGA